MAPDVRIEGQTAQQDVFKEFCRDRKSIRSLGVTPQEMEALSRASLLGTLSSKEDLLFMLKQLRENPVVAEKNALTMPNTRELAENLRHSALSNLKKRDALIAKRNSPVRRFIRTILGQPSVVSPDDIHSY
jgi:hypothetical protein